MAPDSMPIDAPARTPALSPPWRAALIRLGLAWGGLLLLFAGDWRDMAAQWWGSSTYNHILLIPPVLVWLVAQRRVELLRLTPRAFAGALPVFGAAALLWLLGEFAGVALVRQTAVVIMAQAAVAATLGPQVVAGLLFPLGYMLLLVPFGDELIPYLQTLTARLTMVLLHLAQVPATISGVFITTPAGYFEVAEACSGIKFLIAMLAYGALVANVCYLDWRRRAAFMAVSLVVPVLANGVRAFGTIWIAGKVGIGFASSFDHIFYGWVFFAVVMALCVGAGWRWFDRRVDAPMIDPAAIAAQPLVMRLMAWPGSRRLVLPAMLALALAALGWGQAARLLDAPLPRRVALPALAGWQVVPIDDRTPWQPRHGGADQRLRLRMRNAEGQMVDLSLAIYANQGHGREAAAFGQGDLPPGGQWAWERAGPAMAGAKSDVIEVPADGPDPERRLCLTWYRSGALLTGSNLALRGEIMADHLLLRRHATTALIVSASNRLNRDPAAAINAFLAAIGPVDRWLDRVQGG